MGSFEISGIYEIFYDICNIHLMIFSPTVNNTNVLLKVMWGLK
jgi:hypothetical protein